jgi:hypothetical protein
MTQEWKDVVGYEGVYQVSNLGEIRRILAYEARATRTLVPAMTKSGYLTVSLWHCNKGKSLYVHRVVCEAFHGTQPGYWCNHKDGNRTNNCADNLEWLLPRENEHHAIASLGKSNAGERNGQAKLTAQQVRAMRLLHENEGYSVTDLASMFNVARRTAANIVARRTWVSV